MSHRCVWSSTGGAGNARAALCAVLTSRGIALALLAVASGCSSYPLIPGESPAYAPGTQLLAEVGGAFTEAEINGTSNNPFAKGWREKLHSVGIKDADIVRGNEIGVNSYCYGHNSRAGCRHVGAYAAHVDPSLRGKITFKVVDGRNVRSRGDLVILTFRRTASNELVGVVTSIYRKADDWQDCRKEYLNYRGMAEFSPFGPPVAMWHECDGLEKAGWIKSRVHTAPPPSPGNPEGYVHEWIRLPHAPKS